MSILGHTEIDSGERAAYIRQANALRRGADEDTEETTDAEEGTDNGAEALSPERFAALEAHEQFLLTIADTGFGKRSSAYEYRVTRRGGKGIELMKIAAADGLVAAAFTVESDDQIMLVTDGGKLIRTPVTDIRIAGRSTRGVTLFRIADDERVVSVAHLIDVDDEDAEDAEDGSDLPQANGSGGANGADSAADPENSGDTEDGGDDGREDA